ncbi:hypothetical protein [Endozoicomonas sp. GU-1]|uniref:hypothetical protein n=1 Tax=Endozoicomonas sp. GU-1 TaxID=3009078 RepID=UPI0022B407D0|nr:hypothetical protein [Endozoicomonas sp. GU-1]WBA82879.1 hypothetical protein O2T12_07060 [Endozoicomonas sp. GU-1]WBA85807.1 hypothetical protein O3276_21705 [Endozoicomonas sp. GU-1]
MIDSRRVYEVIFYSCSEAVQNPENFSALALQLKHFHCAWVTQKFRLQTLNTIYAGRENLWRPCSLKGGAKTADAKH